MFGAQYWLSTQERVYGGEPPGLSVFGKLYKSQLLPPPYKRTAGRPKKKRGDRSVLRNEPKRVQLCGACGGPGHNESTCPHPSTEYRVNKHQKKADAWVDEVLKVGIDEMGMDELDEAEE